MDIIDKIRAQWDDPEFIRSLEKLDTEPPMAIVKRMERIHARAERWRKIRRILIKASVGVLLGLAAFRLYAANGHEPPLQAAAFMLEMAALFGLNLLDKARRKYAEPKLWLPHREFLRDEHRRMDKNIGLDQWFSAVLSVAVAGVGLYALPFFTTGLRIVCLVVTAAAVCVLLLYNFRKIAQLKRERDDLAADLDDLLSD
jgi:hypothetical protein